MPKNLPERPHLDQLRRQAKELHRAATGGDAQALARIRVVSEKTALASAQLALAREYGFASWQRLKTEVDRKTALANGDVEALGRLVAAHPELAAERVSSCYQDDPTGTATALNYVGVARFHGLFDHHRAGDITQVLLAAGAPVDGPPGSVETPLITAASYGETDMARALIAAGADLEATASPTAGGVPGGTALAHAAEFGNTGVVDVLVTAGAIVHDIAKAAAAGDLAGFLAPDTPITQRARALRVAAINQRLHTIDQLLATGMPIDSDTDGSGPTALHWAAWYGKPAAVRHLLARGADPNRRDGEHNATPLDWCRHRHAELARFGEQPTHTEAEHMLAPLTDTD